MSLNVGPARTRIRFLSVFAFRPSRHCSIPCQRDCCCRAIDEINIAAQYGVGGNAYTRTTPILARHPLGATGRRPLILWSHGGGMLKGGKYNNEEWGNLFVRAGYTVVHMSHRPRTVDEVARIHTEFGLAVPDSAALNAAFEFARHH